MALEMEHISIDIIFAVYRCIHCEYGTYSIRRDFLIAWSMWVDEYLKKKKKNTRYIW